MGKLNVAIADDNERIVQLLENIVRNDKELEVVGKAGDGEEIVNIIKQKEPDVVLLDIVMPKMDGLSVMEKINRDSEIKKRPAFIVITVIANRRGLNDAAAVGIVEKFISIVFLVPSTMLSTVSALSAQNIGAGKHEKASATLRYAIMIAVGFGIVVAVITQFTGKDIVGIFTNDESVIVLGDQYLRSYIWDCVFAGIHFSFSGYFCAYGLSGISFLHNVLSIICVRIPGAYYASLYYPDTLYPMGFAAPGGSLLSVIVCVIAFCIVRKRRRN